MENVQEVKIKDLSIGRGRPKICVPIVADTKEGILLEAERAQNSVADLVEWRGDLWQEELTEENILEMIASLQSVLKTKPLTSTISPISHFLNSAKASSPMSLIRT